MSGDTVTQGAGGRPGAPPAADPADPIGLAELLAGRLSEVYAGPVRIEELHRLTGGASRETWSFVAHTVETAHRLVLRRDPPGADRPEGMALEAVSVAAAERAGVPVPQLVDHRPTRRRSARPI